MARARRAIVVGGSMGGLAAALFLRKLGYETTVHERVGTELAGRGAGIVTHPELEAALAEVDVRPGRGLGVAIEERRMLDRSGAVTASLRRPQIVTSWNGLFVLLRDAFPSADYRLGQELVSFESGSEGVEALFSDGTRVAGDLLVGADGFRSSVRAALLPEVQPLYAGYVAWRGLVQEAEAPTIARDDLLPYFAFELPPGEQILGYPATGHGNDVRPGRRRYNFVWYRPADEAALVDLLTDAQGRRHELSIPPPAIRPEVVERLREDARRTLSPQFAALVAATPQPFLQPIYDLESPRLVFGRVVLLGDAAFVARPHVGAGVWKAASDAQALARAIAGEASLDAALARYEAERLAAGRRAVAQARRLGAAIGRPSDPQARAFADARRDPQEVMAETATLDFLAREG